MDGASAPPAVRPVRPDPLPADIMVVSFWHVTSAPPAPGAEFWRRGIIAFASFRLADGGCLEGVPVRRDDAGGLEVWVRPGQRFANASFARALGAAVERYQADAPAVAATDA